MGEESGVFRVGDARGDVVSGRRIAPVLNQPAEATTTAIEITQVAGRGGGGMRGGGGRSYRSAPRGGGQYRRGPPPRGLRTDGDANASADVFSVWVRYAVWFRVRHAVWLLWRGRFHLSVVHVGVCRERGEWVLQRRGSI